MNTERTCGASPSNDGLGPLYPQRDIVAQGQHYMRHLEAMTREGLHAKSDIAAELAARDIEIEYLCRTISIVRQYPDFDEGGPLALAMDQALSGQEPEILPLLEKLAACGVEGHNVGSEAGPKAAQD
jgi:hypothetical protein